MFLIKQSKSSSYNRRFECKRFADVVPGGHEFDTYPYPIQM